VFVPKYLKGDCFSSLILPVTYEEVKARQFPAPVFNFSRTKCQSDVFVFLPRVRRKYGILKMGQ
jgi:hypothetical protein